MKTLAQWSLEEYHQMIAAGILHDRPVELIAGEIIEVAPESPLHRYFLVEAVKYLRQLLIGVAEVYEAHPVTLGDSEPEPDIAIVKLADHCYKTRHPAPGDIYLLVEISDTTLNYDLEQKKKIYAGAQIPEYWVISVQQKQVMIFQAPQADDYQVQTVVSQGDLILAGLPTIKISLSKILGEDEDEEQN